MCCFTIFQNKNVYVSIQEKSHMYALIWKHENNAFGIFVVIISGKFATVENNCHNVD